MSTVERHSVDPDAGRTRLDLLKSGLPPRLGLAQRSPSGITMLFSHVLMMANVATTLDPAAASAETQAYFTIASEAGHAQFLTSAESGGQVVTEVAELPINVPTTGPDNNHTAANWLASLWLAVICRSERRIHDLAAIPIETLRASGAQNDEFMYSWVESLQKFFRSEDFQDIFVATMEGTAPEAVPEASAEVTLQLLYPPIEMFYHALRRDSEKFNESLLQALNLHRRYWSAEERAADPNGFVALSILGVAVLAKQASLDIEVRSDYLPEHLLFPKLTEAAESE